MATFWITRDVVLRATAFIYFVAFLVSFNQNEALIGEDSLMPVQSFMNSIEKENPDPWERTKKVPTLLWYIGNSNFHLNAISIAGLIISAVILSGVLTHALLFLALWVLYHSIVNVGQRWFSFGWESQLLETGFLCVFLAPWVSLNSASPRARPSKLILWLFLWLEYRIMLGAGMIKIRGDHCWRDLTCMLYHYETQPNPLPTATYMHQTPDFVHKLEVLGNHAVELGFPWLIIIPNRMCRSVGGFFLVLFQVVLISSGNLSFLNWLTIVPCLAAFDDETYKWILPKIYTKKWEAVLENPSETKNNQSFFKRLFPLLNLGFIISAVFTGVILYLSQPVMMNILSSKQIMNTSFDSLRLVNTYGAFGSVGKTRYEVVLEATHEYDPPRNDSKWIEYQFKCKPGNIDRRPCIITPYHYRLDWVIWFAGFEPHDFRYHPWILHLIGKLLAGDKKTLALMDETNKGIYGVDEMSEASQMKLPTYVRASFYEYKFTSLNPDKATKKKGWQQGKWWSRKKIKEYIPPMSLDNEMLKDAFKQMGWSFPRLEKAKKKTKTRDEL